LLWAAFASAAHTADGIACSRRWHLGTVPGRGPFADQPPSDSLLAARLLDDGDHQISIGGVVAERKRDEACCLPGVDRRILRRAIVSRTLEGHTS